DARLFRKPQLVFGPCARRSVKGARAAKRGAGQAASLARAVWCSCTPGYETNAPPRSRGCGGLEADRMFRSAVVFLLDVDRVSVCSQVTMVMAGNHHRFSGSWFFVAWPL